MDSALLQPAAKHSDVGPTWGGGTSAGSVTVLALLLGAGCAEDPDGATATGASDVGGAPATDSGANGSAGTDGSSSSPLGESTSMTTSGTSAEGLSHARDVYPIWARSCGCHITEFKANPNVPVLDPATSYATLLGDYSWQVPSMKYVVPGEPDSSYVWRKVRGTTGDLGTFPSRMPLLGSDLAPADLLSDEDLDVIKAWVLAGAEP